MSPGSIALGVLLGTMAGWLGYRSGMLNRSGGVAAAMTGALIFGSGGIGPALLIITFFVSSSLLTGFKRARKQSMGLEFEKGGPRDAWQVLANGGLPALLAVLSVLTRSTLPWLGYVGALAAATADTWATEIGVLSQRQPRAILSGRVVPRGTSGGVTFPGYAAAATGSLVIGIVGLMVVNDWKIVPLGLVGGLAGATVDSLLGAGVQAMYYCPACGVETERRGAHRCGGQTSYRRGWRWLHNDGVNLIATAVGALVTLGLAQLWP